MENSLKQVNKTVFFDYDENNLLLFHFPSYSLVKVEKKYEDIVIAIIKKTKDKDILNSFNLTINELAGIKKNIVLQKKSLT